MGIVMEQTERMLSELLVMEWEMFTSVNHSSGRAACQDDKKTFMIMRTSQFLAWDEITLASYYDDVKCAAAAGRNMMTEKYARMMERTWPEEYRQLEGRLERVQEEKKLLVMDILNRQMELLKKLDKKYAKVVRRGRPLYSYEDTGEDTSTETYLYGELQTYSVKTLQCYLRHIDNLQKEGRSLNEEILTITARFYGFSSLGSV